MKSSPRSFAGQVVWRALDATGEPPLPRYRALIDSTFADVQPAYATTSFGDLFRRRGRDATWVASLLASDSYTEGYSATRLWQYASSLPDPLMGQSLRRHATDEAKHSRFFATALLKTFPQLENRTEIRHWRRPAAAGLSPGGESETRVSRGPLPTDPEWPVDQMMFTPLLGTNRYP